MTEPLITRETIKSAMASHPEFANVSKVAVLIITMADNQGTSFGDLAKLIETEPELSKRILNIANSSSYGFKQKITSISHAVVLLGWNAIKMVALGSSIITHMFGQNIRLFNHSMLTAQIARFLATKANFYKVEEIAVVGLLHDIGSIILEICFPDEFVRVRQAMIDKGIPLYIAERELLGLDHSTIGGWTLDEWNLPENIVESVAQHHSFDPGTYHARKTAVIHAADVFARAANYKGPSWEKVPEVSEDALDILGFTNSELKDIFITITNMKIEPLIV